ncbi:uncharacterized protein [Primulina eburnea]|uniref:uncharacterized protein n=1 Tax=Primulina eburnea TaxID=1245227 RepID=UPI003C6C6CD3
MIFGGYTDGDSNRVGKVRGRREYLEVDGARKNELVISFGPEDLKGVSCPHNDDLVIQARVANYDVMRVFVDSNNSVNVIFKEALVHMDFKGHAVYPKGDIVLPVTLGTWELRKTVMNTFIIVDAPSSFIILGRPTMSELKAVASTYHQKIKFPIGNQVGEVQGDQPSSRKCYVEAVRADQKKANREENRGRHNEEMERVVEKGEELIEISPLLAEHNLNILPGSQPIKQNKRHFGPEKDKVIDVQGYHQFPWPRAIKKRLASLPREAHFVMHYGVKLNPAKCIIGVKSGEFLGYVMTDRGIEVNPEKVNSVLIREEDSNQKPVYYASHVLGGAELWYSEVEKIVLSVVVTIWNLQLYFLSHPIIVLTNSPLRRIMTHSEVFGRLIKWTVELGEYDIEYRPRVAIKAQDLSEIIQSDEEEVWRAVVDGASSLAGCGVGVVTNNGAEYEVFLAGVRAALKIGASRIILYSDSQLVTQQIKGIYETKDDIMLKYLKFSKAQTESFVDWSIEQIPREDNGEADALAKMAASLTEVNTREVLHVTRLILSTDNKVLPAQEDSWMTPLIKFIAHSILPEDQAQAQKINKTSSQWVEAESLAKISEKEVLKFLWKRIVCRFGVPRRLILDNGRPFQGNKIEVVNMIIVQALKTRLQGKEKDWVEELPSVLWAYMTTSRDPTQENPFNLVYGYEAVLHVEIGKSSARVEYYPDDDEQRRAMELDLVEEKREQAMIQMEAYQGRVMKSYNKRVWI